MREIRTSGSEGGAGRKPRSYLYLAASATGELRMVYFQGAAVSEPPRLMRGQWRGALAQGIGGS